MKKLLFLLSMTVLGNLHGAAYQPAVEEGSIGVRNETDKELQVSLIFANELPYNQIVKGGSHAELTIPKDRDLISVEVIDWENKAKQKLAAIDLDWEAKKSNSDLTLVISKNGAGWSVNPEWISAWGGQAQFEEGDLDEILARLKKQMPADYEEAYSAFKALFKDIKESIPDSSEQRAAVNARFKELARRYHPDKGGTKGQFQALQNAYNEVLSQIPQNLAGEGSSSGFAIPEDYVGALQAFRKILKDAYKDVPGAEEKRKAFEKKYRELSAVYDAPNMPEVQAYALEVAYIMVDLDLQTGI